jgi:radical SAM protein with 4Fe4S-binding SPASM domain
LASELRKLTQSGKGAAAAQDLSSQATQPFVVRLEYFGCLLYDRRNGDYIPFDTDAAKIFQLAVTQPRDRIYSLIKSTFDEASLNTFYTLCQQINIFDSFGRFTGVFLKNPPLDMVMSAPTQVHLAVTNACNFRCGHCFASSGQPHADELTTFEIKRLIDDLAEMGCFKIKFGGGEPLVRRDLPELIRYASDQGLLVSISTNAVAATKEVVESLAGLKFEEILVSVDGASAEVYDAIRGEAGAFRQAMAGIANLKALKTPIALRRVLMKANANESAALVQLAEKLEVKQVLLRSLLPVGRAAAEPDMLLDAGETNHAWQQALAINNPQVQVAIPQSIPNSGRKRVFEGFGCECGHLQCYIDPRGTVSASGLLKDLLPSGNIRQQSLRQIWASGFGQFRGMEGNKYCRHCSYFRGCRGGCRASGLLLGKDLNAPDGNCLIAAEAGWQPGQAVTV